MLFPCWSGDLVVSESMHHLNWVSAPPAKPFLHLFKSTCEHWRVLGTGQPSPLCTGAVGLRREGLWLVCQGAVGRSAGLQEQDLLTSARTEEVDGKWISVPMRDQGSLNVSLPHFLIILKSWEQEFYNDQWENHGSNAVIRIYPNSPVIKEIFLTRKTIKGSPESFTTAKVGQDFNLRTTAPHLALRKACVLSMN